MAVNFSVNIFHGPHGPIPYTVHHRPAIVLGSGLSHPTAGSQIGGIGFMNIGLGMGFLFPAPQKRLGKVRGHIQVQHKIRLGKSQVVILKFVQPL